MKKSQQDRVYLRKDHTLDELRVKLSYEYAHYFQIHALEPNGLIVSYNLAIVDSAQVIQFAYRNSLTIRIERQPSFSDPYFYFTEV